MATYSAAPLGNQAVSNMTWYPTQVTLCWHWAKQSLPYPNNAERLAGKRQAYIFLSHWFDLTRVQTCEVRIPRSSKTRVGRSNHSAIHPGLTSKWSCSKEGEEEPSSLIRKCVTRVIGQVMWVGGKLQIVTLQQLAAFYILATSNGYIRMGTHGQFKSAISLGDQATRHIILIQCSPVLVIP